MSACIITGGSGFIGTHLIKKILKENSFSKIYVLDLIEPQIKSEKIVFLKFDIRNRITFGVKEHVEICFHLAAVCKEPGFHWDEYFRTNYVGTRNVCDWMETLEVKKIIFTSTMMVYRASEHRNVETSLTAPDTAYGISKLLAENYLESWLVKKHDHRVLSIRLGVVFGSNENGNYTRLKQALKHRMFFYVGRDDTVKSGVYIKDVARFIHFHAVKETCASGHVCNFAINEELTIKQIAMTTSEVFGYSNRIFKIPYKLALASAYLFELLNYFGISNPIHHRRIQKLRYSTNICSDKSINSGFEFKYDLRKGLEDWRDEETMGKAV